MTPAQLHSSLAGQLAALGLRSDGSRFVCEMPEVVHRIDVTAVRRLQGRSQIHHRVATREQATLSVEQDVVGQGLGSPYAHIGSCKAFGGGWVLEPVSSVRRVFRSRYDLARVLSEGDLSGAEVDRSDPNRFSRANTLSAAAAAHVTDQCAGG